VRCYRADAVAQRLAAMEEHIVFHLEWGSPGTFGLEEPTRYALALTDTRATAPPAPPSPRPRLEPRPRLDRAGWRVPASVTLAEWDREVHTHDLDRASAQACVEADGGCRASLRRISGRD
jgi:hypothetical protein